MIAERAAVSAHASPQSHMLQAFRELAALLALALVPALFSAGVQLKWREAAPDHKSEVTLAAAQGLGENVLWVDTRPLTKFQSGHLPGAVWLSPQEWDALVPAFLQAWSAEKTIVVYGDAGEPTATAAIARRLREELRLGNVRTLKRGDDSWPKK